jgi:hypothetical protein
MSSDRPTNGKRLVAAAALATFVLLAVGVSCRGFFVNQPNSVTVTEASSGGSTFSVAAGSTDQLKATATFDSGSKDVTNSASWQSSSACAPVGATTGLVNGISPASSVTVTATLAGVSGTITGSVTGTGGSGSTLLVAAPATGIIASGSGQFTATLNGGDVTSSSTWSSNDTTAVSFSTTQPGFATFGASGQSATVTASLVQGTTCATGTLPVTIP